MDILNEIPDSQKHLRFDRYIYSKCNMCYVKYIGYWSIGDVLQIAKSHVHTWRHCMQMVTIKQYLIKSVKHIWIKL